MKRRVVVTPQERGVQTKERVMTKIRKSRVVKLGDAKRLTKGDGERNSEINLQPRDVTG